MCVSSSSFSVLPSCGDDGDNSAISLVTVSGGCLLPVWLPPALPFWPLINTEEEDEGMRVVVEDGETVSAIEDGGDVIILLMLFSV